MNHKKGILTLAVLLALGAGAWADVAVKDLGKGEVALTYTHKDDAAAEMGVIGSFDNWTVPGEAMTKNAAGLWEVTLKASATDEITYKFYSKGTYIKDENAPDFKDDGYGGKNGLILVADILSGAVSANPAVAPVPAAAGPKKPAGRTKLAFTTQTYVESDTAFDTASAAVKNSMVAAYSNWRFDGDLMAGMPGHFEVTAFQGQSKVYDDGTSKLDASTGLQNAAGGILFSPFYYLGGNKRPTIEKFRFGVDSAFVEYDTGYGSTPFPVHSSILWDTSSSRITAGAGYSSFRLGKALRSVGDLGLDLGLVPNMSLGGHFGLMGWAAADLPGIKVEVQYDMRASAKADTKPKTDASQFFKDAYRQDFLGGAEAYLGEFLVQGQALMTRFAPGSAADNYPAKDRTAYKVTAGYRSVYEDAELVFAYAYRGSAAAQLLFANLADSTAVLGAAGTQSVSANGFLKFGYWGTFRLDSSAVLPVLDPASGDLALTVRPSAAVDFSKLGLGPVAVEAYLEAVNHSKPGAGTKATALSSAGAKVSVDSFDVYYKAQNADTASGDLLFQTLLTEARFAGDLTAQAGYGFRSGSLAQQAHALFFGASWMAPVPEAKNPVLYAQFVWNLDPYNTAASPFNASANAAKASKTATVPGGRPVSPAAYDPARLDLTGFGPTNGASAYDGLGALRVGVEVSY